MRLRFSFPLILAWLCLGVNPIRAQTSPALPDAGEEGSISGVDPVPRALAYKAPDATESFARPAYKSVAVAYSWSILGAVVPVMIGTQMSGSGGTAAGLVLGGLLLGPSLGQFYAGSLGGGMLGVGIRTGGAFMGTLGLAYLLSDMFCMEAVENDCGDKEGIGGALLIVGVLTYLGGAVYSLMDAEREVERYNARQNDERVFGWSPTVAPTSHGGLRAGALAYLRF